MYKAERVVRPPFILVEFLPSGIHVQLLHMQPVQTFLLVRLITDILRIQDIVSASMRFLRLVIKYTNIMLQKNKLILLLCFALSNCIHAQVANFDLHNKKDCKHPYVVNVEPKQGTILDLSQDTVFFRITFSQDMGESKGLKWLGEKVDYYWNLPTISDVPIKDLEHNLTWDSPRILIIKFPSGGIRKAEIDGFTLIYEGYANQDYSCWMAEDYTVRYKVNWK